LNQNRIEKPKNRLVHTKKGDGFAGHKIWWEVTCKRGRIKKQKVWETGTAKGGDGHLECFKGLRD